MLKINDIHRDEGQIQCFRNNIYRWGESAALKKLYFGEVLICNPDYIYLNPFSLIPFMQVPKKEPHRNQSALKY
jgi:hypothetical protein